MKTTNLSLSVCFHHLVCAGVFDLSNKSTFNVQSKSIRANRNCTDTISHVITLEVPFGGTLIITVPRTFKLEVELQVQFESVCRLILSYTPISALGALIVEDDADAEGLPEWYTEMEEMIVRNLSITF